jgi:hypothetical protein
MVWLPVMYIIYCRAVGVETTFDLLVTLFHHLMQEAVK